MNPDSGHKLEAPAVIKVQGAGGQACPTICGRRTKSFANQSRLSFAGHLGIAGKSLWSSDRIWTNRQFALHLTLVYSMTLRCAWDRWVGGIFQIPFQIGRAHV